MNPAVTPRSARIMVPSTPLCRGGEFDATPLDVEFFDEEVDDDEIEEEDLGDEPDALEELDEPDELVEVALLPDAFAVLVTAPDPGVAVPVDPVSAPPEFWLPLPCKPGPDPAPVLKSFAAALGIAGSASSLLGSQLLEDAGQVEAADVVVAPPVPWGFGVF